MLYTIFQEIGNNSIKLSLGMLPIANRIKNSMIFKNKPKFYFFELTNTFMIFLFLEQR